MAHETSSAAAFMDAVRPPSPPSPRQEERPKPRGALGLLPRESGAGESASSSSAAPDGADGRVVPRRSVEPIGIYEEDADKLTPPPYHQRQTQLPSSSSLFTDWPFVGRGVELETIRDAYRRVKEALPPPPPPPPPPSVPLSSSLSSSQSPPPQDLPICEFVVVEGPAGCGKTRLVHEALQDEMVALATLDGGGGDGDGDHLPAAAGYLCEGRFDPTTRRRAEPQAAMVNMINGLVASVLKRGNDDEVVRMSRRLSEALGEDRAALVEMVPSVRDLFLRLEEASDESGEAFPPPETEEMPATMMTSSAHDDPSVSSSTLADLMSRTDLNRNHGGSSTGGQMNKFKHVVRRFLHAVASPDHPLVLLLDDVQWADETSLDFLWTLLSENRHNPGLLVVATYRVDDDDAERTGEGQHPDPTARIWTKLQQEKNRVNVTLVKVPNLAPDDVESLLTDVLETQRLRPNIATTDTATDRRPLTNTVASLSSLLYECTRGNPLLIRENVLHLRDLDLFTYNESTASWEWDSEEVRVECTSSLSKVVRQRVLALPSVDVETLKVAACLGATVDEELLSRVMSEPYVPSLGRAVERGLLTCTGGGALRRYTCAHHQVGAEAYGLIPTEDRKKLHCILGRKLWENLHPYEVDKYMFPVIGQFIDGDPEHATLRERKEIALLFARAGERAIVMSSFQSAYTFLSAAIDCLGESRWRDSYTLSLNLHNAAAEIACCIGMYSNSERLASEAIKHARSLDDTYRAQSTRIYSLGGRSLLLDAISVGLDVLQTLGVTFPSNPTRLYIWRRFMSMKLTLKRRYTYQSIMRLPFMTDRRSLAASQVLNLLYLYATSAKPELAPLIGFALIRLTLKDGLCPVSCMGFVTFAMCLCGFGNDIDTGYEFGQLALKMYDMFKGETWLVRLTAGYYGCVHPWKKPIPETWGPLKRAHQVGLESGDIEYSMLCVSLYVWSRFDFGPLRSLETEISDAADLMNLHGQLASRDNIKSVWQASLNLMGQGGSGNVGELNGDILSHQVVAQWETSKYALFIWVHHYEMLLCYIFCRYEDAVQASQRCHSFINHTLGTVDVGCAVLFAGLSNLAVERASPKRGRRRLIQMYLSKLRYWARHAPHNFLGMQFLLEAELASLKGDKDAALSKFVCAIALNREVRALLRVAVSTERLGRHLLLVGQRSEGRRYLEESVKCYDEYGALAKVRHLQSELAVEEPAPAS